MVTSRERPRHGHKWDSSDYQILVAGCVADMPDHEIALGLGRSETAMKDRAEFLVDIVPNHRGKAWQILRETLQIDPDHDWETIVRRRHADRDLPYWDPRADELLEQAWSATSLRSWWRRARHDASLMQELENTLGIHEYDIAERLRYRNLAKSRPEIVERLGASTDGYLAAQARLITDRDGASLGVLIVTDDSGAVLHASLHPSSAAALAYKDKIAATFTDQPMSSWTVLHRALGYGEISSNTTPLTGNFSSTSAGTAEGEQNGTSPEPHDAQWWAAPFMTPLRSADPIDLDSDNSESDGESIPDRPLPSQPARKKAPRQSRPVPPALPPHPAPRRKVPRQSPESPPPPS